MTFNSKRTRRQAIKGMGATLAAAAAAGPITAFPAIAQNTPLKVGIITPKGGVAATAGENGIRGCQWAVERINKAGGIAGRKVELVVEVCGAGALLHRVVGERLEERGGPEVRHELGVGREGDGVDAGADLDCVHRGDVRVLFCVVAADVYVVAGEHHVRAADDV